MRNNKSVDISKGAQRDNEWRQAYWTHRVQRPRHLWEMTTDHFQQDLRYAVDMEDEQKWIHCNAWVTLPFKGPNVMRIAGSPLNAASVLGAPMPLTLQMQCYNCGDCFARNAYPMVRSPLWEHGIAALICITRHAEWNAMRSVHYDWWRAVCAYLCGKGEDSTALSPARGNLLRFGERYFPVLPGLRQLLELTPEALDFEWLKK